MNRSTVIRLVIGISVLLAALFFFMQSQRAPDDPAGNLKGQAADTVPEALKDDFTLNGQIAVVYGANKKIYAYRGKVFSTDTYNANIQKALQHEMRGPSDVFLYPALDDLANQLLGKKVLVIGSNDGWYESILLAYGATPVVLATDPISTQDGRVSYVTPSELANYSNKFDFIIDISGVAKEGLGSGGEQLDPNGDLKAMAKYKELLESKGKLVLAIPIGIDEIIWNTHRIYGKLRLKALLHGWRPIKYYGFLSERLDMKSDGTYQPVFLLESK